MSLDLIFLSLHLKLPPHGVLIPNFETNGQPYVLAVFLMVIADDRQRTHFAALDCHVIVSIDLWQKQYIQII